MLISFIHPNRDILMLDVKKTEDVELKPESQAALNVQTLIKGDAGPGANYIYRQDIQSKWSFVVCLCHF